MRSRWKKTFIAGACAAGTYMVARMAAKKGMEDGHIDDGNPYLSLDRAASKNGMADKAYSSLDGALPGRGMGAYEVKWKPALDHILSFCGLVALSPLFAMIALAVVADDPGPVFFSQKRVGRGGHFIKVHKFRSMRSDAPHNVPTHQLSTPEKYITRVGGVLRKSSLDELPQLWDVFRGRMSMIGPRPALWNQGDLVKERDKYGANDIMPGLTGLAQISGRDELGIVEKAALDGQYAQTLKQGGPPAFLQDVGCLFGTIGSVLMHNGVVEGGAGAASAPPASIVSGSQRPAPGKGGAASAPPAPRKEEAGFADYGHLKYFSIDKRAKKKVLIAGAGSYIGESFQGYCSEHYPNITCTAVDMVGDGWRGLDFSGYDAVFHVAGIAHADVGRVSAARQKEYYAVNADLAVACCKKAKRDGVKQFILMGSMIVYGEERTYIDETTVPKPSNFYGDSKWLADKGVRKMGSSGFQVAVVRSPMVYGKGSKGNYPALAKIARTVPVFPKVGNKRSILYIENLCEFVSLLVLSGEGGIYFPQNKEYASTSQMARLIGDATDKKVIEAGSLAPLVKLMGKVPGKVSRLAEKAFGNCVYDKGLSRYAGCDYQIVGLEESIKRTESKGK